uniref:Uncharacterized protein n=1 Tax=Cannabis sativa TaxID=3483 RepID=A0A803NI06_CANSA
MEKIAMGHTPFSFAFGSEVMFPVKVNIATHRREFYNQEQNNELQSKSLDLLEEKCTESQVARATYQHRLTGYFNKRVQKRLFKVGDLVRRRVFANMRDLVARVFNPNWEGPYIIETMVGTGVYKSAWLNGSLIKKPLEQRASTTILPVIFLVML